MGILNEICKNEGIKTVTYKHCENVDSFNDLTSAIDCGFATIINGQSFIFYDDQLTKSEKEFTVAHEIGHHLLGHLNSKTDSNSHEMEANIFASVFMALKLFKEYKLL